MLASDINVAKQVEEPKYAQDGTRTVYIRVEYYVGKHGPFVDRIPKEEFSADARDARLNAWADQVRT